MGVPPASPRSLPAPPLPCGHCLLSVRHILGEFSVSLKRHRRDSRDRTVCATRGSDPSLSSPLPCPPSPGTVPAALSQAYSELSAFWGLVHLQIAVWAVVEGRPWASWPPQGAAGSRHCSRHSSRRRAAGTALWCLTGCFVTRSSCRCSLRSGVQKLEDFSFLIGTV